MMKVKGKVGAFWVLPGSRVIGEACPLSEADCIGNSYGGPSGHNSLWHKLPKPALFWGHGYSTVPRGRVLYRSNESCFVVFAAPEIVADLAARQAVEAFYDLLECKHRLLWETDPHYTTEPDIVDEADDTGEN